MSEPADLVKPSDTIPATTGESALRFGTQDFYAAVGRAFITFCAVIPALWLIELLDTLLRGGLERLGGIHPWDVTSLGGIVFAPLLHRDFAHVAANSVPLLLLGTFALAGQVRRFLAVTLLIAVVSGLGVWFTGAANSYVVGASGVIFGLLGYLVISGLVDRTPWRLGAAVLVALLYGWTIIGVLPGDTGVSWQAHLFGAIGGIAAAIVFRTRRGSARKKKKPDNPFLPTIDPPTQ